MMAILPETGPAWDSWLNAAEGSPYRRQITDPASFWDDGADRYDRGMGGMNARVDALLAALEQKDFFLTAHPTALDIGSGTGSYALPLAQRGVSVTALDASPAMQGILLSKAAQANIRGIEAITAVFERYRFGPRRFDLVLASLNPATYHPAQFKHMVLLANRFVAWVGITRDQPERPPRPAAAKAPATPGHNGSNLAEYPEALLLAWGFAPELIKIDCLVPGPEGTAPTPVRMGLVMCRV